MAWPSIFAIYFIVWFLSLFMVLPFGVQRVEDPELGHDLGAPVKPMLIRKAIATTILAAVFTTMVVAMINAGWFDFRIRPDG